MVSKNGDKTAVSSASMDLDRRFNDLNVGLYNLLTQWDSHTGHCSDLLEAICNNRIRLMDLTANSKKTKAKSGDATRQILISDEILRDSESLVGALPKFEHFISRLQQYETRFTALRSLLATANSPLSVRNQIARCMEIGELFPSLVWMYERELSFKRDSLRDLACFDDKDLFSVMVSSWRHGIYIEPAVAAVLYPF